MKGTMVTFAAGEAQRIREFDRAPTLDELKTAIGGGWIESVPYFDHIEWRGRWRKCWTICDEEGKLKRLLVNPYATMLWAKSLSKHGAVRLDDVLVGPVAVLFGDDEFMATL